MSSPDAATPMNPMLCRLYSAGMGYFGIWMIAYKYVFIHLLNKEAIWLHV